MTLLQTTKTCPKCKTIYLWNPSLGQGLYCPNCADKGMPPKSTLEKILRQNKDKKQKK